jgi:serine/threonine protein kinase
MPTLEKGQMFERYRIIQWLGSGLSGESYEAEDTILLRKVTLKLIHPKSTLPESARRQFFREMQSISILNHSYLVSILDYGEIDGKLYIARRYVSNGSLLGSNSRMWFPTPLNVSDVIHYGHQLAQTLQYIHNRGYLHGALTFSNILVLRGPNVEHETDYAPFLLADVGLSNFVRRFGEQDSTPLPITAAPEQLGKRVIPASDQFALAVVLYFWLTGHLPYVGTPEEIEYLKLTETITPPSSLNPKISVEQDGIVLRALSVYPEDRYPAVLAFANALLSTLVPKSQPVLKTEAADETTFNTQVASESASEPLLQIVPASSREEHSIHPVSDPPAPAST